MIIRCHAHQHPEDYGRLAVDIPGLPDELIPQGYESVGTYRASAELPQEPIGHPDAIPI
jgi:hypothetical protein